MKQKFKYIFSIIIGSLIVSSLVWAAFPDSLSNVQYNDTLTETMWNNLESTVGITNSSVVTSHDYLIRRLTDDWDISGPNALTPTSTRGLIVKYASSTFMGYITAEGGFTGNASTADALKANGTNCSAGSYPLGIDSSGNAESCTALPGSSSNWNFVTVNAIKPTTTVGIIINASSTFNDNLTGNNFIGRSLDLTYGLTAATTTLTGLLTVGTITTGIGETEIYQMNQAVRTTDSPTFLDLVITKGITAATSTWSGKITANGGILSTASSTINASLDLPNITVTGMNNMSSWTYTTTSWSGTTTIALGPAYVNETWFGTRCFTNAGTVSFRYNDGTNNMDWVVASTTGSFADERALTTNRTFTAGEKRYVTVGSPESGPNSVSCTVNKRY